MFALVDCNNFYASCERVFRPDLVAKPIVVLSNNDGCVIARSNEAKSLGIPMGAPAFEYETSFTKNNIHVFSANFALYGDMSQRVMSIIGEYAPNIEIYSIDECFLKFDGCDHLDLQSHGISMLKKVKKWTGIPICVGIAPTKALAKVANKIAKKYPDRTEGVYQIDTETKRIKALQWLPIEEVWGIGKQHSRKLKALGVRTAYDFTLLDDQYVRRQMSVVGLRLKQDLQGIPILDLEVATAAKNIATTRSFEKNYTSFEDIKERIITFTTVCAEKLRRQNSCCNTLSLFLNTDRFRTDSPQYHRSIQIPLPYPTNSSLELVQFAVHALHQLYKEGYAYKKGGVILHDFTPQAVMQQNLFQNSNQKHVPLMRVIDTINASMGQQKVRLASQDLNRVWKMKQEKLSPCYTTKLKDIISIY